MKYRFLILFGLMAPLFACPVFHAQCLGKEQEVLGLISYESKHLPWPFAATTCVATMNDVRIMEACIIAYPTTEKARFEYKLLDADQSPELQSWGIFSAYRYDAFATNWDMDQSPIV